jgi:hypothetical protein
MPKRKRKLSERLRRADTISQAELAQLNEDAWEASEAKRRFDLVSANITARIEMGALVMPGPLGLLLEGVKVFPTSCRVDYSAGWGPHPRNITQDDLEELRHHDFELRETKRVYDNAVVEIAERLRAGAKIERGPLTAHLTGDAAVVPAGSRGGGGHWGYKES